jgi:hypothetical protein
MLLPLTEPTSRPARQSAGSRSLLLDVELNEIWLLNYYPLQAPALFTA